MFALSGGEIYACLPGDIKRYTEGFLEILETFGDAGEFFCHIFFQWFYSSAGKERDVGTLKTGFAGTRVESVEMNVIKPQDIEFCLDTPRSSNQCCLS